MTFLFLMACTDPAIAPYQKALKAYEAGRKEMEAGHPQEAAQQFAAAREADPHSSSLRLWEAKALADAGKLTEADAAITSLIREQPDLGVAWYNRAAWRVRAGRKMEAAQDLQKALELGEGSALQAAGDPDFLPVRTSPEFASFLPDHTLLGEVKAPPGAVFIGSRFELSFRLISLPGDEPTLRRGGEEPGCLTLTKVVEDRQEGKGEVIRTLVLTFQATRACATQLGPFTFTTATETLLLDPVTVTVEAPSSMVPPPPPPPLPVMIPLPGAWKAGEGKKEDAEGEALLLDPGAPLDGRKPDVQLELRRAGQTLAVGGWWRKPGGP